LSASQAEKKWLDDFNVRLSLDAAGMVSLIGRLRGNCLKKSTKFAKIASIVEQYCWRERNNELLTSFCSST
jgi:hypothetical protein